MAMWHDCQGVDLQDDQPTKCWKPADIHFRTGDGRFEHEFCWAHLTVFIMIHGEVYGTFSLVKRVEEA